MKINGKKILKKLEKKDRRKKVSLYLSEKIYEDFKKSCGETAASRVMEELMEVFVSSIKNKK